MKTQELYNRLARMIKKGITDIYIDGKEIVINENDYEPSANMLPYLEHANNQKSDKMEE